MISSAQLHVYLSQTARGEVVIGGGSDSGCLRYLVGRHDGPGELEHAGVVVDERSRIAREFRDIDGPARPSGGFDRRLPGNRRLDSIARSPDNHVRDQPKTGNMLDRLMGWPIFTKTN